MAIDFPTSPSPGQQVTSGSRTWTWSGSYWANNTITGVQGTQGIQGTQGTQGVQGIQGVLGTQGAQGLQGIQGIQGVQGIQGNTGIQGTQGTQGIQGIMGAQGAQGTQGTQGAQGIQGTQGTQGLQGITGSQGAVGTQGITGSQGTQGTQGVQGIQGISGASILGTNNSWTGTNTFTYNAPAGVVITGSSGSSTSLKIVNSNYSAGNYWHLGNDSLGGFTLNQNGSDLFYIGRSGTTAASFAGALAVTGTLSTTGLITQTATNTYNRFIRPANTNWLGNQWMTGSTAEWFFGQRNTSDSSLHWYDEVGGADKMVLSTTGLSVTGTMGKSGRTVPSVAIQSGVNDGTPSAVQNGDFWWNTDTGVLNMWWSTASAWIAATPVPDSAVFFRTSGGNIVGNVGIQGLLSVTGNIQATGTITGSYSDERLKDVSGNIKNALAKVMLLNGVEFKPNDTAKYYGFNSDESEVGVIAQQVQAVLPEVVKPAPFDSEMNDDGVMVSKSGENYITVQYERMVPLLIEAIKEQQHQIEKLNKALEQFIKE